MDILVYGEVSKRNRSRARCPWIINPRLPFGADALPGLPNVEGLELRKCVDQSLNHRVLRLVSHLACECVHLSEMGCESNHFRFNISGEGSLKLSYERPQSWIAIEDIDQSPLTGEAYKYDAIEKVLLGGCCPGGVNASADA
jgi:hypothetical protein